MRKLHRMEEAVADYTLAIQVSPPSLRFFNNRAYCLAKLGRYSAAVQDYSAVLRMEPNNQHALQNRCATWIMPCVQCHNMGTAYRDLSCV